MYNIIKLFRTRLHIRILHAVSCQIFFPWHGTWYLCSSIHLLLCHCTPIHIQSQRLVRAFRAFLSLILFHRTFSYIKNKRKLIIWYPSPNYIRVWEHLAWSHCIVDTALDYIMIWYFPGSALQELHCLSAWLMMPLFPSHLWSHIFYWNNR